MKIKLLNSIPGRDFSRSSHNASALSAPRQSRFLRILAALALFLSSAFVASHCYAQSTTGDVVGTVTDSTGSVVPGAQVVLTNEDTQEKRTVTTDESGQYVFTLLKPNRYSVAVTRTGFKKSSIAVFNLSAGD